MLEHRFLKDKFFQGYFLLILTIVMLACDSPTQKAKQNKEPEVARQSKTKEGGVQRLYVTNPYGTSIYENPSMDSKVLGFLDHETMVEIIEAHNDWYVIKERVKRNFEREGKQWSSWNWENVYVSKEYIGESGILRLSENDLYELADKSHKVNIRDKIQIETISKGEFYAEIFDLKLKGQTNAHDVYNKSHLVFSNDSMLFVKPENKQTQAYKSLRNARELTVIYGYQGHVDFPNVYILSTSNNDFGRYQLYNSKNGSRIHEYTGGYPLISPNKKKIASVFTDIRDHCAEFHLYEVKQRDKIKAEYILSFKNWLVAVNPHQDFWRKTISPPEKYWIDDSTIILKAIHEQLFRYDRHGYIENFEYLKIKLL